MKNYIPDFWVMFEKSEKCINELLALLKEQVKYLVTIKA